LRSIEHNAVPWQLSSDSELREKIARLSEVERKKPNLEGLSDRIDEYRAELERRQQEATQDPPANTSKAWLAQVGTIACSGPVHCHVWWYDASHRARTGARRLVTTYCML